MLPCDFICPLVRYKRQAGASRPAAREAFILETVVDSECDCLKPLMHNLHDCSRIAGPVIARFLVQQIRRKRCCNTVRPLPRDNYRLDARTYFPRYS